MKPLVTKTGLACALILLLLNAGQLAQARESSAPHLTPLKPSGHYDVGERVGWVVSRAEGAPSGGAYRYTIKKNNFETIAGGELNLATGPQEISVVVDEPAMLFAEIVPLPKNHAESGLIAGAAVAPRELKPVAPRPADFDAFWRGKIEEQKKSPINAELAPGESGRVGVDYATIRMDHSHGGHIHGQIAQPTGEGKHPALLILQWASPPYPLEKPWVVDHAATGWLTLNIEPHDVLPTEPQSYYDALPDKIKRYESIGQTSRDESYFVRMYLAAYRAVEYLIAHPNWDGKTLVVMGTSMGGQQGLCVAGLHEGITHLLVNVPAGCDLNASLHGRQMGYPFFDSSAPSVMETARYVDAVNFAPNIRAKSLIAMGFVDRACPPAGIWTAVNQIPGPTEPVPMVDSPHNHIATPEQQAPWTERSAAWLDALVRGEDVLNDTAHTPRPPTAFEPAPRTDANSQHAHRDLLEKARLGATKGRVDVYFVGDSITRRWGCTDPQYKDLLESWRRHFHGWNAANFAWGGDSTSNILWRLENGELDGLSPKVFVVMAGTNNVGSTEVSAARADPEEIALGVKEIIETCRRKAPEAKVVLTAVFPRNDNRSAQPVIREINKRIAEYADGDQIRYLNINHLLADENGELHKGMMMDGLHPAAPGYEVWAAALKPILTEWLGPPAEVDLAPPPTGDPSARP